MTFTPEFLNSGRTCEDWEQEMLRLKREFGFNEGFKPLYCPWSTLEIGRIAFLSPILDGCRTKPKWANGLRETAGLVTKNGRLSHQLSFMESYGEVWLFGVAFFI